MNLFKKGAFGRIRAFVYSIEYQKRGLPHAHILTWNHPEDKLKPDEIDSAISCEIPNKNEDPDLHGKVMSHMIHGPCQHLNPHSPCMVDNRCSKSFPKDFLQATQQGVDAYPKYRRRKPEDGGYTGKIKMKQCGIYIEQEVTNQWVVPYNPFLLKEFNSHINVEACSSINAIKYILKYISKGSDMAVFELQRTQEGENPEERTPRRIIDEIAEFQNARYIGSSEAAWRISRFPTHEYYPQVVQLAIHLENGQRAKFSEENALQRAFGPPPPTTLTAFFDLCNNDNCKNFKISTNSRILYMGQNW